MTDTLKVLGQAYPTAVTDTNIYTVPAVTSTVVSTITVCNQSATASVFRIAISPAGATLTTQHYIYYDAPLSGNATFAATVGLSLATTDVVRVRSSTGAVSFSLFGTEVT